MADLVPPRLLGKETLARSRALRRESTDAERRLWSNLRSRMLLGRKFRRQYPIGDYIVDFCSIRGRLVVELDGEQHVEQRKKYDDARTKAIEQRGFKVVRFWNHEVMENTEGVLEKILGLLEDEERRRESGSQRRGGRSQNPHLRAPKRRSPSSPVE